MIDREGYEHGDAKIMVSMLIMLTMVWTTVALPAVSSNIYRLRTLLS